MPDTILAKLSLNSVLEYILNRIFKFVIDEI